MRGEPPLPGPERPSMSSEDPNVLGAPASDADAVVDAQEEAGARSSFLVLRLGALRFAFPATAVEEIAETRDVVPVPQTPSFVRGVFQLGGRVIALLELRALLGLAPSTEDLGAEGRTLVLNSEGGPFGLRVDAVLGLEEVDASRVKPAADDRDAPVVGTFLDGERLVSVLDPQRLVVLAEARVGQG